MDDKLVLDSSGAWVWKTVRLAAEKQILLPDKLDSLPCTADHSFDSTINQRGETYTALLDY